MRPKSNDFKPASNLPVALADAELLARALQLRGDAGLGKASDLLAAYGGLGSLTRAAPRELSRAQRARLRAVAELGRRAVYDARGGAAQKLNSAARVVELLAPIFAGYEVEVFLAIDLNSRMFPIAPPRVVAVGHATGVAVHPREVFRGAVQVGAISMIVAHNHPSSGDPEPSPEDLVLTERLRHAGAVLGIAVLDHVIVGAAGACVSLHERGVL